MDGIKDLAVRKFILDCVNKTNRTSFEQLFPGIEADALDLLKKLLCYEPSQRLSAEEALQHPYFTSVQKKEKDCQDSTEIDYFDFEFE